MNLDKIFISDDISIKVALQKLDDCAKKILLVVDNKVLKGVITDGDIRRFIIKNGDINKSVSFIMNTSPVYLNNYNLNDCKNLMMEKSITAIPILNEKKEVTNIIFFEDIFFKKENDKLPLTTPVVIMAGGKGTRLYPFTKIIPKPLIPIGETTILERIINKFLEYNLNSFYLSINYKKEIIKAYLNEKSKSYNVSFVEEDKPLGTAGSLSLLKDTLTETFFVSNCDILVDANYLDILKKHKESKNKITIITSLKYYVIPYGVINLNDEGFISSIDEKPEYNFLINTGMYILEPDVLDNIPKDQYFDMPDLIDYYIKNGYKVGIYPVSNNAWLDMGEFKEMENMIGRLNL